MDPEEVRELKISPEAANTAAEIDNGVVNWETLRTHLPRILHRKRRSVRDIRRRQPPEMKKHEEAAAPYIPTDLIAEILYRFPSSDLLNFKHVCRDWQRLISSPGFIQKHLERSKAECTDTRIVVLFHSEIEILDCANNNVTKKISVDLLGSCDGLVLWYDHFHDQIGAFNPSIKNSVIRKENPSIGNDMRHRLICSWLGNHPSTGEYVLVLANVLKVEETKRVEFKVYSHSRSIDDSLLASTIEELDGNSYYSCQRIGTLLHGRLHFPLDCGAGAESKAVIFVYDFEANKIVRMRPPEHYYPLTLGVVDGCLSAIHMEAVWIMKEYGFEESWTKYADIEGPDDLSFIFIPLAFCPNGDVILNFNFSRVISKYSFRNRTSELLKAYTSTISTRFACVACVDSLVSPDLLWREEIKGIVESTLIY